MSRPESAVPASPADNNPLSLLKDCSVMLIDDSKAYLSVLRDMLLKLGCVVDIHSRPGDALDSIASFKPEIMIVDYNLHDQTGAELIEKIKQRPDCNLLPVIIMTASPKGEMLIESFCAGAIDFISKDEIVESLPIRIASVLKMQETFQSHVDDKQLEAIKTLIGTYKHEFGNKLLIVEGACRQIKRKYELDESGKEWENLQKGLAGFRETLKKLDKLRRYSEEEYSENAKILKINGGKN